MNELYDKTTVTVLVTNDIKNSMLLSNFEKFKT